MKNFMTILFVFAMIIGASACSESSTNSNTDEMKLGSMTCKVDGETWNSMTALALKVGSYSISINAKTSLTGGAIQSIAFTITGDIKEGPVTGASTASFSHTDKDNNTTSYNSMTPEITITRISDGELHGTFDFTGTTDGGEAKVLTDGSFRLKLNI